MAKKTLQSPRTGNIAIDRALSRAIESINTLSSNIALDVIRVTELSSALNLLEVKTSKGWLGIPLQKRLGGRHSKLFNLSNDGKMTLFNGLYLDSGIKTVTPTSLAYNKIESQSNFTLNSLYGEISLEPGKGQKVLVDVNSANTVNGMTEGLHIDYDHTGISASGQLVINTALDIDLNSDSPTHVGSVINYGVDIELTGGTSGTQTQTGIYNKVLGGDANIGYVSRVTDGGVDFRLLSTNNTSDYCQIGTTTHGATEIKTVDDGAGTLANITLNADGKIIMKSESNNWRLNEADDTQIIEHSVESSGAKTNWYHTAALAGPFIQTVTNRGATQLGTVDASGSNSGDLHLVPQGKVIVDATVGGLYMEEDASAGADVGTYGQIWVKNSTPNELYFTTDAGDDIQLTSGTGIASSTPQYHYDIKNMGFNASSTTAHYLPITGYIIERTSPTSANEYVGMITPYDCTVEKFAFRSEVPQDGTASFRILESSDDTEVPGTLIYRKDVTIDIADDTYYEWDLTSPSVGSVPIQLTKGRIYAFYIATPSAPYDTNVTIVFKWDVTS